MSERQVFELIGEEDGSFSDIPGIQAVEKLTGKPITEALDDQALAVRRLCGDAACTLSANFSTEQFSFSGQADPGISYTAWAPSAACSVGCARDCSPPTLDNCPNPQLVDVLFERIDALVKRAPEAVEQAKGVAVTIRQAHKEEAQGIRSVRDAQIKPILAAAKEKVKPILDAADAVADQIRDSFDDQLDEADESMHGAVSEAEASFFDPVLAEISTIGTEAVLDETSHA